VEKVVPKYFDLDQVPVEYGGTGKLVLIQDQRFPGWPPELPAYVKRAQKERQAGGESNDSSTAAGDAESTGRDQAA
jgi:hypothetical protein